jgi:hypothetical protein
MTFFIVLAILTIIYLAWHQRWFGEDDYFRPSPPVMFLEIVAVIIAYVIVYAICHHFFNFFEGAFFGKN